MTTKEIKKEIAILASRLDITISGIPMRQNDQDRLRNIQLRMKQLAAPETEYAENAP